MPENNKILIAQIVGVHGIKGWVKLRSFAEDPEAVFSYFPLTDKNGNACKIEKRGIDKDNFLIAVEGIATRNDAELLKGCKLYVPRDALPALQQGYYHADLIGLQAFDGGGKDFGIVKAIHNFGAGDIMEISGNDKKSFMLLYNDINVSSVDLAAGRMTINPPAEV